MSKKETKPSLMSEVLKWFSLLKGGKIAGYGIILIVIGGLLFYNFKLAENIQVVPIFISGPRDWIYENFTVPAGENIIRGAIFPNVSTVTVEFNLTSDDSIDFLFLDQQGFLSWQNGSSVSNPFPWGEGVAEANISFSIPHGGGWAFVWDNVNYSEPKEVSANVTWTGEVIDYREVTKSRSFGEQMLWATGEIVMIVGIWFAVFGLIVLFVTYRSNRRTGVREQSSLQPLCLRKDFIH